jgi:predicted ATPase
VVVAVHVHVVQLRGRRHREHVRQLTVDESLVMKDDVNGLAWYRLHETMREYARLKLREAGEQDRIEQRCADH